MHRVVKIACSVSDETLDASCAQAAKDAAARGLPFAESCEYNKHALHLLGEFCDESTLNIIRWQLSEMPGEGADVAKCEMQATRAVHAAHTSPDDRLAQRLHAPVQLDVSNVGDWNSLAQCAGHPFNFVFTANTFHIMPWSCVIYGPFNYGGAFTTDSNRRFDGWLKTRNAASGIRDFEAVCGAALKNGFELIVDFDMPANNRLLVFALSDSTRSFAQLYRIPQ